VATLSLIDADAEGTIDRGWSGDESLAARARDGDRDALEALLRASYGQIFAVCRRMTGNDADAADAAQDALVAIVRGLPRFDGRSRFATWAYRIAVNASIDELRRRARRSTVSLELLTDRDSAGLADAFDAESAVARVDVDGALLALPLEYRAPVVLRDLCGLDYAEIAEVLGVPGGTVRSRIARGRSMLAISLGKTRTET
jgi:RNA polymerase sigma-70 factor, ECF subfamily